MYFEESSNESSDLPIYAADNNYVSRITAVIDHAGN